ncbi:hypothetical protein IPF37_04735 [bacterium]|nr:MAG: hypothetical protein IPF37_04735 [bacterium]
MKKKIMLLAGLFIVVSVAGYRLHAGRGGNAFGGAFAGSMFGSVVGNAMTAPRGGGGDSGSSNSGALNAVWDAMRRLESSFADEIKRLKEQVNHLEDQVRSLKKRGHRKKHDGRDRGKGMNNDDNRENRPDDKHDE